MTFTPNPKPRMGRPSDAKFGVMAVTAGGQALAWSDGEWAGTPEWVAEARSIVDAGLTLWIPNAFGAHVVANAAGPVAAYAVLAAVAGAGVPITGAIPVDAIAALRALADAGQPDDDANDANVAGA